MKPESEADQIKRELAILRNRHAIYDQSGRALRFFFLYVLPIVALLLASLLAFFDLLYGLFLALMMLVVAALAVLSLRSANIRWIDLASTPFGNRYVSKMYTPYFFYPDARPRPRSDAEYLEWQIADREKRLSELESVPPC